MPENSSVSNSVSTSTTSGSSSNSAASDSSSDSSSSSANSNTTSGATTSESLASSKTSTEVISTEPTTAEKLSGVGSMDAAARSSMNAQFAATHSTPDAANDSQITPVNSPVPSAVTASGDTSTTETSKTNYPNYGPPGTNRTSEALAEELVTDNSTTGPVAVPVPGPGPRFETKTVTVVDTASIANELVDLSRKDPAKAEEVLTAVEDQLNPAEFARLHRDIRQATEYESKAIKNLAGDGLTGTTVVSAEDATANARTLVAKNTDGELDTNSLAYDLERMAEEDPAGAIATKIALDAELDPQQKAELNRNLGGGRTFGERISLAWDNPGQGAIGAGKGIVNGFSALGELFVQGAAMQGASETYRAGAIQSLFNAEQGAAMTEMANQQMEAAKQIDLPEFAITNGAQQGGELIGTGVDIALAGKGLITGGAKILVKNSDEIAEVIIKSADNVDDLVPPNRVYRGDSFPNSSVGKTPDRLKSHLDADGNLRPANVNGNATPTQHVRGSEPTKSNSPYTSLSTNSDVSRYGDHTISVDIDRLRADVNAGKVDGVSFVETDELIKIHEQAIDKATIRYDNNPSPRNLERLNQAKLDMQHSIRDSEILIKGVIPSDYVTLSNP